MDNFWLVTLARWALTLGMVALIEGATSETFVAGTLIVKRRAFLSREHCFCQ